MLGNFTCANFFFQNINIFKKRIIIRVSKPLDPDEDQCFVGPDPDLSPICLQRLSADDKSKELEITTAVVMPCGVGTTSPSTSNTNHYMISKMIKSKVFWLI